MTLLSVAKLLAPANVRARLKRAEIARRHGFHFSRTIAYEAQRARLDYDLAFALVTQESGNGANVFGHDPTIFAGAGKVTRRRYRAYRRQRGDHGQGGMQGVGPVQLTYYTFQDDADRRGGCWRGGISIRVGFEDLRHLIDTARGDVRHALAVYNGGTVHPNFAYADSVLRHRADWHDRFNPRSSQR